MKMQRMLSIRLALLIGLIALSGGACSAGEKTPDEEPLAISAPAPDRELTPQALKDGEDGGQALPDESAQTPGRHTADQQAKTDTAAPLQDNADAVAEDAIKTDAEVKDDATASASAVDRRDQATQTDDFDRDKVNINTASAEDLVEGLKGIGPKKAQAIVDYRNQHGPFNEIEQLTEVKGIGPATLARNKNAIEL